MKKFIIILNLLLIISCSYCINNYNSYLGLYSSKDFQIFEISKENNQYYLKGFSQEGVCEISFKIKFYSESNNLCFSIDTTSDEFEYKDFKFQRSKDSKNTLMITPLKETVDNLYKINDDLKKDDVIAMYGKYSDLVFNYSGYYLNQNNDYLYYICSDYPKVKIIRYKLNDFVVGKIDESVIYLKKNNFYTNFDNNEYPILITYNICKIGENETYKFSNEFTVNYNQIKFGDNLILAKYIYNKISNIQFKNFSEKINEEYYKNSFIIITIFGTYLFSSVKSNFIAANNNNFIKLPIIGQVELIELVEIKDYFQNIDTNKNMNFPDKLMLKYNKWNAIDIIATGQYNFEVEFLRKY